MLNASVLNDYIPLCKAIVCSTKVCMVGSGILKFGNFKICPKLFGCLNIDLIILSVTLMQVQLPKPAPLSVQKK